MSRTPRVLEHEGLVFVGIKAAADHYGLKYNTLRSRLGRGMTLAEAVSTPVAPEGHSGGRSTSLRAKDAAAPEGERWCQTCEVYKPLTNFHKQRRGHLGLNRSCKRCQADRIETAKYGMNKYDVAEMQATPEFPDGLFCRIHNKSFPPEDLYIDHCHDTDEVRGLLCNLCNVGLGAIQDNPVLLHSAVAYLIHTESAKDSSTENGG